MSVSKQTLQAPRFIDSTVYLSADLFDTNFDKSSDNSGTGYAQHNFKAICPSCQFEITKDNLAAAKFVHDLVKDDSPDAPPDGHLAYVFIINIVGATLLILIFYFHIAVLSTRQPILRIRVEGGLSRRLFLLQGHLVK